MTVFRWQSESVSSSENCSGKLSRRLEVRVLSGAPFFGARKVYGERSSVGRAPDCDSGRRGFESHRSPHLLTLFR